ncbi:tetraspanin-8-like [Malania oleifera]|uniref:tetraspanin-8-like n=1 Tax=Malania oleifera TaxID=397392 RepID=UPI0025AEB0B4|nr:tetraspanin-8-like [Malania oleifera]
MTGDKAKFASITPKDGGYATFKDNAKGHIIGVGKSLHLFSSPTLANCTSTNCKKFLEKPVIVLGVFLMVVLLARLIGACCRVLASLVRPPGDVPAHHFAILLHDLCVCGDQYGSRGGVVRYKEYRLGDYSNWLHNRVNNGKNWNRINSCL